MKQKYKNILAGILLATSFNIKAQTYINKQWERFTGLPDGINYSTSTFDSNDNLIVVGNTVVSAGNTDVLITKYDPTGNMLWQQTFNGTSNTQDYGVSALCDSNDNIYLTSAMTNTGTNLDITLMKLNANGTLQWSSTWNGTNNLIDIPSALTIDNLGQLVVVGVTINAITQADYAILKFDTTGQLVWHSTYDFANLSDIATGVTIDNNNNVIVTGGSASASNSWDYTNIKYNGSNGIIDTVIRVNIPGLGLDKALAVTRDSQGNIYITGYSEANNNKNIQTLKINANFSLAWVKNFDGENLEDIAKAISVDGSGNVYTGGTTKKSNGGSDYILIKYDANGNDVWKKRYTAPNPAQSAELADMKITSNGEIIIAGTIKTDNGTDFGSIKYDENGVLKFEKVFTSDGIYNDKASNLALKDDNSFYVTGQSKDSLAYDKYVTIKYQIDDKPNSNFDYVNGVPHNTKNELVIIFQTTAVKEEVFLATDLQFGQLSDFINDTVINALNATNTLSTDWGNCKTQRVFTNFTSKTDTSISRTGTKVFMENYWATLTVQLTGEPTVNLKEKQIADTIWYKLGKYIKLAEPNYIRKLTSSANDDLYVSGKQSGLINNTHGVNIQPAWSITSGSPEIKIGVYDSGINGAHNDFASNGVSKVLDGKDIINNTGIGAGIDSDIFGHGTACASIIGALRNNGAFNDLGIAGISGGDGYSNNEGCKILPFALLDENGDGTFTSAQEFNGIIEGAFDSGNGGFNLDVMNWSFGGGPFSNLEQLAANLAFQNDVAISAAAGNDNVGSPHYPATYFEPMIMKVGANDSTGFKASFSNFGTNTDFIAPGVNNMYDCLSSANNTDYVDFLPNGLPIDGTSFAAPHVSGVSSLMLSAHMQSNGAPNNLYPEDIQYLLKKNATDRFIPNDLIYTLGPDDYSGYGLINAGLTVQKVNYPDYAIYHGNANISGSSTALTTNSNFIVNVGVTDIPPNIGYVGSIYKIPVASTFTIPSGRQFVDAWPVHGHSTGVIPMTMQDKLPFAELNFTQNGNTVDITGYLYYCLMFFNPNGTPLIKWYPSDPTVSASASFSIHTKIAPAGVTNLDNINGLDLYPNPANNSLNFTLANRAENYNLCITNSLGEIVIENKISSINKTNFTVDIAKLSSGLYTLSVSNGNKNYRSKFIKQ